MGNKRIVAIHQPNFFPWLGFFDKIARCDTFILMDNAQFPKKGGTWINRVKLLIGGKEAWATAPVDRNYHGVLPICEMKINKHSPWRNRLLKTVELNYKKTPFFGETFSVLKSLVENGTDSLLEYNVSAIKAIMRRLDLDTGKVVLGSSLRTEGNATELLISMVKSVGGAGYMCGGGASYQIDTKFMEAGLELIYQRFEHPRYPQIISAKFISGLSIIDSLMNCGFSGVRKLLRL